MNLTEEQAAVAAAIHAGRNVVVQAGAGAGKTSTLREATRGINGRVLYVVYNRAAAEDAKGSFPRHVRASTIHGLAFSALGRNYGKRLNSGRQTSRETARRLAVMNPVELSGAIRLTPAQIAQLAVMTVEQFCYSADEELAQQHVPPLRGMSSNAQLAELYLEWMQLRAAGDHGQASEVRTLWDREMATRKEVAAVVLPVARKAWADLQNPDGNKVRFVPDHYLKMYQLTHPDLSQFDAVLLDEAQDSNPVTVSILTGGGSGQLAAIGDSHQQLYAWRGAVDALAKWPADETLYLTQSWRFGQQVADEANKWLSVLGARLRVRGNPGLASVVGPVDAPDAVLCRTNGGAITQLMTALEDGRRPAMAGGAGELIRLVESAQALRSGQPAEHPELCLFTSWAQVQEHAEEPTGSDLRVFVDLVDGLGPAALLQALRQVRDPDVADVVISTAHKSKGLEWGAVRIHDDYPEPKTEHGRRGSIPRDLAMLAYVAVTRAKLQLDRSGLEWVDSYLPMGAAA